MEKVLGIGGVFFKARDPKALAAWYREHLGVPVEPEQTYGAFTSAAAGEQAVWSAFPADTSYFGSGPAPFMVNYRVRNLDAMLAQLRAAGVQVDDRVDDYDFGRFGWATDPEGNRFELWEPGAHRDTGRAKTLKLGKPGGPGSLTERSPMTRRVVEALMAKSVTPFLMFEGAAEEAVNLYVSLFRDSSIRTMERYRSGEGGAEGSVKQCHFTVAGLPLRCFDSPAKHAFTFTPSVSLFVDCESEAELDAAFASLSAGGKVMMPPGNYGFSVKFAWVSDPFGVSWQLNLP